MKMDIIERERESTWYNSLTVEINKFLEIER